MNIVECPLCNEHACIHNECGECLILTETGGTEKVLCGWYKSNVRKQCFDCSYSLDDGKSLLFCQLKSKRIPKGITACEYWRVG